MLREPGDSEPDRIGLAHLLDVLLEDPARRSPALAISHQAEVTEVHCVLPSNVQRPPLGGILSRPRTRRRVDGLPLYGRDARVMQAPRRVQCGTRSAA